MAEAYAKLREDNVNLEAPYQFEMDLMKLYGSTNNGVDLKKGN